MVKFKKVLSMALVACMAGSMMVGCNNDNAPTEEETKKVKETTVAEGETTKAADNSSDDKTETTADNTSETTKEDESQAPEKTPVELKEKTQTVKDMMDLIAQMQAAAEGPVKAESTIKVDVTQSVDEDSATYKGQIDINAASDGEGNYYVSLSGAVEADGVSVNSDILDFGVVDNTVYIDLRNAYATAEKVLGEDTINQYATMYNLDINEVKKLLNVGIALPAEVFEVSDASKNAIKKIADLVTEDMAVALSQGDYVTESNGKYTVTINNDNLAPFIVDVLNSFDGNVSEIYDAFTEYAKATDVSKNMEVIMDYIADELVTFAKNHDANVTEEQEAQIREQFAEAVAQYKASYNEMASTLESGKSEAMKAWDELMEQIADADIEEATAQINAEGVAVDSKISISKDGDSFVSECEMTMSVDEDGVKMDIVISGADKITAVPAVAIVAPTDATTLQEALDVIYNIYKTIEENPEDPENPDNPTVGDQVLTQEQVAALLNVTLADDEVAILSSNQKFGAVVKNVADLGVVFEAGEWFNSSCSGCDEHYNYNYYVSIADTLYDFDAIKDYYDEELKVLSSDVAYITDEYGVEYYIAMNGVTLCIEYTSYDDDIAAGILADVAADPEGYAKKISAVVTNVIAL